MDRAARLATEDDVEGMAEALSRSFHDDPVMSWMFGTTAPRPMRYSRPFFGAEGRRHLRHGQVYTFDDHAGAAYWDPPGHWEVSALGILRIAPIMVRGAGARVFKALRGLGRMEAAHRQHPPHYYLAFLGTAPTMQGQGVGSALMAPVLARCDAEGTGAYLESSKPSNIPFYQRHGFQVVGEVTFPDGPMVWPMWRGPRNGARQEAP